MRLFYQWQKQERSNWCWAAVASSVDQYFAVPPQYGQCDIASGCLGFACCAPAPTAPCNIPFTLQTALGFAGHFDRFAVPPTPDDVRDEIQLNQRPLCARIQWSEGGGHFVTIFGYDEDPLLGLRYWVADPITGESLVSEEDFLFNYQGSGFCTDSFYVQ